jgi:glutathione S-transferase-like protein
VEGRAVRGARVKWLLHELMGDDFDVEPVALRNAEQYREEFLVLNPNHAVPVLEIAMEDGKPRVRRGPRNSGLSRKLGGCCRVRPVTPSSPFFW